VRRHERTAAVHSVIASAQPFGILQHAEMIPVIANTGFPGLFNLRLRACALIHSEGQWRRPRSLNRRRPNAAGTPCSTRPSDFPPRIRRTAYFLRARVAVPSTPGSIGRPAATKCQGEPNRRTSRRAHELSTSVKAKPDLLFVFRLTGFARQAVLATGANLTLIFQCTQIFGTLGDVALPCGFIDSAPPAAPAPTASKPVGFCYVSPHMRCGGTDAVLVSTSSLPAPPFLGSLGNRGRPSACGAGSR